MSKKIILFFLIFSSLLVFIPAFGNSQDLYFGKNKVQYQSFNWYFIQTEHFDIYYYEQGYAEAKFAAGVLEDAYKKIGKTLNYDLRKRVPVILYNCPNEFQQTNVVPEIIEENVGGFTEVFKTRVVVPFNGSYEDFRHVLHHELVHAFMFDMLYGNLISSILSRQYLFTVPLWFAEGLAEYSSRGGWDLEADMVLRDATIDGYLIPLDYVGGYLAYKEGQSVLLYIAKKYGEEKIPEILSKGKGYITMDRTLEATIGMNTQTLSEEWMKELRKGYWPEIAKRKEPSDFSKQLTFHKKDGSFLNEKPAYSPQGDRLAIFSDKSDYTEIYIISAIDGKVIRRLVKGERSGDLESLHSYVSGLSWSPDGKNLAFVTKSGGKDVLCLIRVKDKKIYKKLKFDFQSMASPSWSSDGEKIALVGMKDGSSNLYSYDLSVKNLVRLTEDSYEDKDPAWSPDGRFIAFSSDRPFSNNKNADSTFFDSSGFFYGKYNLFLFDLQTNKITPLTHGEGNNISPTWSPDGKKICFVSNRNGINNLYVKDLDSLFAFPITDILSGCFSPSWSEDGDKIAFSSFNQGGYDIFVLKEIKPATENSQPLSVTPFLSALKQDTTKLLPPPETPPEKKLDFTSYIFKAGETELDTLFKKTPPEKVEKKGDTLAFKLPSGEYKKSKYKLKFTPDLVSGALSYDTYFGFRGQSFVMISDIFGNHTFLLATDLINTIDQSNFQLFYQYATKRIDFITGIFHTKYYYIDSIDRLFSDRIYGVLGSFSLPLSKFTRFEFGLTHISIDRKYYDPIIINGEEVFEDRSVKVSNFYLSRVHDTVLWGLTGPVNGTRSILTFEYSPDISRKSISYSSLLFDYRRYWHFEKHYDLVFRFTAGRSDGKDPQQFYLGGTSNWMWPKLGSSNIYGIRELYFSSIITPLRGYKFYDVTGTRFALTNLELRYPFIERFDMRFPLPLSLRQVNGAIFFDLGTAWKVWDERGGRWTKRTKDFKGGTGGHLKDLKAGFGFGARANLGIFILRFDTAWKTDFSTVGPRPIYYFSLGAEF